MSAPSAIAGCREPFADDAVSMSLMNAIQELADRARNGDRDALSDLVEMLRPRLFAVAYSDLGHYHDAQDAVASALGQICLHVSSLRETEHVWPWMRKVVRNEALKIRNRNADALPLPDDLQAPDAGESNHALEMDIRSALRRLPRDNARAMALFYLAGVSIDEIARRMGRPVGTIKRWLHLGRRQMAVELEDYAPMKTTKRNIKAAIISTDIPRDSLARMVHAIEDAGFDKVGTLIWPLPVSRTGEGDTAEVHIPAPSKEVRFVIIDEWVAGRSAFEIQAALKAAVESNGRYFGILLSSPISESTVLAAWGAGFELCLSRDDLDPNELRRFSKEILSRMLSENP